MAYEFRFPDVGEGITEGEVVRWRVAVGDRVEAHQPLLEVETDKAVVEIPSPVAGTVLRTMGGAGDVIQVGQVIALIGDASELAAEAPERPAPEPSERPRELPDFPIPGGRPRRPAPAAVPVHRGSVGVVGELEEAPEEDETPAVAESAGVAPRRVEILPRDRALARELGVDVDALRGTGPRGRVTEQDVRRAAERGGPEKGAAAPEATPDRDGYGPLQRMAVRGVRRRIAEAMVRSLTRAAQVTTVDEADIGLLAHIRAKEKGPAAEQGVKLTLLAFVMKAVVGALKREPYLNAVLDDEAQEIVLKGYYNLGVAVETRDGLIVPNVKNVDKKTVLEVAREVQELAERARKRTLELADVKGGTFTVTNFGSIGGLFGTPILNDPEVGILGLGKAMERPVPEAGGLRFRKVLPLSLTFDHRVVDGATAQHFLNAVIRHLEDPDLILIGG